MSSLILITSPPSTSPSCLWFFPSWFLFSSLRILLFPLCSCCYSSILLLISILLKLRLICCPYWTIFWKYISICSSDGIEHFSLSFYWTADAFAFDQILEAFLLPRWSSASGEAHHSLLVRIYVCDSWVHCLCCDSSSNKVNESNVHSFIEAIVFASVSLMIL